MTMIVTAYDNPADEYKTIFKAMTDIIFVKKKYATAILGLGPKNYAKKCKLR